MQPLYILAGVLVFAIVASVFFLSGGNNKLSGVHDLSKKQVIKLNDDEKHTFAHSFGLYIKNKNASASIVKRNFYKTKGVLYANSYYGFKIKYDHIYGLQIHHKSDFVLQYNIETNKWIHVCFYASEPTSTAYLYVDGKLVRSLRMSADTLLITNDIIIGTDAWNTGDAFIANYQHHSGALNDLEIVQLAQKFSSSYNTKTSDIYDVDIKLKKDSMKIANLSF